MIKQTNVCESGRPSAGELRLDSARVDGWMALGRRDRKIYSPLRLSPVDKADEPIICPSIISINLSAPCVCMCARRTSELQQGSEMRAKGGEMGEGNLREWLH